MKEQDQNKAWGYTLFCDDLRVELGGKISVMGLYQSDLLLPENVKFPVHIAKLSMLVMYYEAVGTISEDLMFKVTFGEESKSLIEFPFPRKDLPDPSKVPPSDDANEDSGRIYHGRFPVTLSPFTVPARGRLRVRAHYSNDTVLKLGSLALRQVPIDEFNQALKGNAVQSD